MEVSFLMAFMFFGGIWLAVGIGFLEVWKDMFNDISSRPFRATARILMLLLWPAWLVFWAVCVAIAITILGIVQLCE